MKKILIADDSTLGRELIQTILAGRGYSIVEARDGVEALAEAARNHPDLIILDIHMPGLDGYAVMQELRRQERFAAVPIVALTASAMSQDRAKALDAGFTAYFAKPIRPRALRTEVERLIRSYGKHSAPSA